MIIYTILIVVRDNSGSLKSHSFQHNVIISKNKQKFSGYPSCGINSHIYFMEIQEYKIEILIWKS